MHCQDHAECNRCCDMCVLPRMMPGGMLVCAGPRGAADVGGEPPAGDDAQPVSAGQ